MPRLHKSTLDRLMSHVRKTRGGHWIWTGSKCGLNHEYGQCNYNGRTTMAHRAVWMELKGPIPDGLDILHQCGRPACVNPAHVRVGTHRENILEAIDARGGKFWDQSLRGQNNHMSKFSDDIVDVIRRRHANGESQREIADEYGVTQPCISMIIGRKRRAKRARANGL